MFMATCNLETRQGAYRVRCDFGTTTDRDEFDAHMKAAHPERTTQRYLSRLNNPFGSGWTVGRPFKARTGGAWGNRMKKRLVECPDCGAWCEAIDDRGLPVDTSHDCGAA